MMLGDVQDGGHVGRQARVVHRHDGPGLGRDGRFNGAWVDVHRRRVDVHQAHIGAQVAHHFSRGREGVGGGDDLVARANAQGFQGQMQTRRGRVHGHAVQAFIAQKSAEVFFELRRFGAGGDPARPQGVDHFSNFFFANFRQGVGQERCAHVAVDFEGRCGGWCFDGRCFDCWCVRAAFRSRPAHGCAAVATR